MLYTTTCILDGKTVSQEIPNLTNIMLDKWRNGMPIQDAMPSLSPDEREFIMTGINSVLWNEIFPEEEE